jgi:hypothetical protein
MNEMIYVTEVAPLEGLWIRVTFSDEAVKEIDLSELLAAGGVFAPIWPPVVRSRSALGHRSSFREQRTPSRAR